MTEDDIKKECERLFQNGGSKVYWVCRTGGSWPSVFRLSTLSASSSLRNGLSGWKVYARQKVRNERRYAWRLVGVCK